MRYVNMDTVTRIISQHSMKAASQWDMDAVIVCGDIMREIEALPEGEYVELSKSKEDRL